MNRSMKEWGVSNELELLREIIHSSPYLREKVSEKIRDLKSKASENLLQEVSREIDEKEAARRREMGE